jgi:anti-anti-sigma factor
VKDGRSPDWGGHLLLLYREESQRRSAVAAWVRSGLEVGAKILYTEPEGELPARSLSGVLRDEPEAVEAMESGQIQVVPANRASYDATWQAGVVEQALRRYPSVRWSGDATTAWRVMSRAQHVEVERATEQVCNARPLSVMCQYPAHVPPGVLQVVSQAHGAGLREQMLQVAPIVDGVAVSGEVDISNQDILGTALLAASARAEGDRFVVDLSELDFLDVGGARTLLTGTDPHRRLDGQVHVKSAQPHLARLLWLLDVDRAPGVVMEGLQ